VYISLPAEWKYDIDSFEIYKTQAVMVVKCQAALILIW
jgi:hypothetical protein